MLIRGSRAEATAGELFHTKSATGLVAEYPDLAMVAAAWPELPDAVRAGIVAMVEAATN
jgi:hypothetical protein